MSTNKRKREIKKERERKTLARNMFGFFLIESIAQTKLTIISMGSVHSIGTIKGSAEVHRELSY